MTNPPVSTVCPVCGSADHTSLGPPRYRRPTTVAGVAIDLSDLPLRWRRCGSCGYWFISPTIPRDRLLACYAAAPAGHWETDRDAAHVRFYAHKKELVERFAPGRRVLDFGCFDGGFLAYLGAGYEKFGIEPAAEPARVAATRGVNVLGATLAAVDTRNLSPLDAVVALDVFEHFDDPVATLRALAGMLCAGGVVLIETGDTDSPGFRRYNTGYNYAVHVEHVGVFNRRSISEAGRRAGLSLAHVERSAHHRISSLRRPAYALWNAAYHLLRAVDALRVPLPVSLQALARGPLPRPTKPDHFIAVLRKEA